jgi:hypothetical protein
MGVALMSWFKRSQPVPTEVRPTVDLQDLAGLPGELLFAQGLRDQMVRIPCTVLGVERYAMAVEPTGGTTRPGPGSAVILEVLHRTALVQCFTNVLRLEKSGPIALNIPARPHIVLRRRNQRVEVYLGVILLTPERPIEETPAQMINVSLDGAACVLTEPLATGTGVCINMTPLGIEPPIVSAEVVRCTPTPTHLWVIGLRFMGLSAEQESFLSRYINSFIEMLNQVQNNGSES